MTRELVLSFVKEYHDRHGKTPSVREISDNVPGVNRANLYSLFDSKSEILSALGIEAEPGDLPQEAASMAREAPLKTSGNRITLSETQSARLNAISFMTEKTPSMIIDELLDAERSAIELFDPYPVSKETISAVLDHGFIWKNKDVSPFCAAPWIVIPCSRCGSPVFFGEKFLEPEWSRDIMPILKKVFRPICGKCVVPPVINPRRLGKIERYPA